MVVTGDYLSLSFQRVELFVKYRNELVRTFAFDITVAFMADEANVSVHEIDSKTRIWDVLARRA